MSPGTALGLAGLGLVLVYLWTRSQQRPAYYPAVPPPGPGPGVSAPTSADQGIGLLVDAAFHPQKYNQLIFGVGPDTFVSYANTSDFRAISDNMCCCYHGNQECCLEALEQAPGLRTCKPGDCDCHPVDLGNGQMQYRDARGGPYFTTYGSKEIARQGFLRRNPGAK